MWKQKFGRKNLDELHFIKFMKQEIKNLLDQMEYKGSVRQNVEGIVWNDDRVCAVL